MSLRLVCALVGLTLAVTACADGSGPGSGASSASEAAPPKVARSVGETPQIVPEPLAALNPTTQEYAAARAQVRTLSLDQLAGQVIVARYQGTSAPENLVSSLHLGGVIVFTDNITSTDQIASSNAELRKRAGRPLMIGVDQEGGVVERVKRGATRFPAFMSAGAADRPDLTEAAAAGSAKELAGLGFTTVFAPEADVTSGAGDPTIGSRSAGSDPELVGEQLVAAADGIASTGLMPVLKHFPGHGSVPADSHKELPVQTRSRSKLDKIDLAPFRKAIEVQAPAIMVGHIDVRAIDPGTPSSLSAKVITGLLREELGFNGLVVTDALDMAGVRKKQPGAESVLALKAGADVMLMPASPLAARDSIVAAVRDGTLERARLEEAATRMLAYLEHQESQKVDTADPGSQNQASQDLSAAAITVVAGPCSGNLVAEGIRVLGSPDRVTRLQAAAREAGIPLGRGKTVALVGYRGAVPKGADIVVATDTPYVLGRTSAPVRIATYGDTPGAMRALIAVLTGQAKAPGTLPVQVSGVPRTGC